MDLYLLGYASTLVKDSDQLGWDKLMSSISDGVTIVLRVFTIFYLVLTLCLFRR